MALRAGLKSIIPVKRYHSPTQTQLILQLFWVCLECSPNIYALEWLLSFESFSCISCHKHQLIVGQELFMTSTEMFMIST